ncbi:MAG: hypothetical protein ACK6CT_10495, partial [Planctomycetia bacterium]
MVQRTRFLVTTLIVAVAASSQTGCFWLAAQGPNIGPLAIPIPVPVGIQKAKEDQFWNYERYERAPVLGPLQPGGPCEALDEPSDDEVMRALEKARPVQGNWPFLYEVQRNHVRISKCKISDYIDPPRHLPLVGPVQVHHAHYKCTVYFQEVKRIGWPVPHTLVDEDCQEVVYIDHDHMHMVGDVCTGGDADFCIGRLSGQPWPRQAYARRGDAEVRQRRAARPPAGRGCCGGEARGAAGGRCVSV